MKNLYLVFTIYFIFGLQFGYSQEFHGEAIWEHKPGVYYMLDYPVRIRSQPNLQGDIIGILGINSQIKVVSSEGRESIQKINNIRAPWYKIQFENITGYVWGGYIAAETLVFDIDNNGIDDYFHYRISDTYHVFWHIDAQTDIIIYINNEKMSTTAIRNSRGRSSYMWCTFEKKNGKAIIILSSSSAGPGFYTRDTFEIDKNGRIILLEEFFKEDEY
jgi:hypothetical protein